MRVKLIDAEADFAVVELTRRNLTALLAKLDFNRNPGGRRSSECEIMSGDGRAIIRAVEDEVHYSDRLPGEMLENETGRLY